VGERLVRTSQRGEVDACPEVRVRQVPGPDDDPALVELVGAARLGGLDAERPADDVVDPARLIRAPNMIACPSNSSVGL
jgi:hypothetical protein